MATAARARLRSLRCIERPPHSSCHCRLIVIRGPCCWVLGSMQFLLGMPFVLFMMPVLLCILVVFVALMLCVTCLLFLFVASSAQTCVRCVIYFLLFDSLCICLASCFDFRSECVVSPVSRAAPLACARVLAVAACSVAEACISHRVAAVILAGGAGGAPGGVCRLAEYPCVGGRTRRISPLRVCGRRKTHHPRRGIVMYRILIIMSSLSVS